MKVNEEHISGHDDDSEGFDICVELSELGVLPGFVPPTPMLVELPSGELITFDLCGQVVGSCDRFLYWSYWNEAPGPAINLQVKTA